ncbi:MAG: hypothetical protein PF439_00430, partial [Helicobacteraceae bacterium]|nr:hypothetical protein [Helicobacteraceae bacterium]
ALMLRITTLFPTLKKPRNWLFLNGFHLNVHRSFQSALQMPRKKQSGNALTAAVMLKHNILLRRPREGKKLPSP